MVIPNILIQFEIKSIEQEVGWCTQTGTQMTDFNSKITVFGRRGREGERRPDREEGEASPDYEVGRANAGINLEY